MKLSQSISIRKIFFQFADSHEQLSGRPPKKAADASASNVELASGVASPPELAELVAGRGVAWFGKAPTEGFSRFDGFKRHSLFIRRHR